MNIIIYPRRAGGLRVLTNDERRARWAQEFYLRGLHRQERTPADFRAISARPRAERKS